MEYIVKKGIFLAPKSYNITTQDGKCITKHKGLAKSLVDRDWFESQYLNISRILETTVSSNFRIEWETLNIIKKETLVKLSININTKRTPIFINNVLVDTEPKEVIEYGEYYYIIQIFKFKYENLSKDKELSELKREISILKEKIG